MARYDFRTPRLFVHHELSAGGAVPLGREQLNYLANVLRLSTGASILVFNGRDGEWGAVFEQTGKRAARLMLQQQVRPQEPAADLHYLFAPLKHARLDYMVQKAVELGVSRLQPVLTQHTQATRVNRERMQANVIEAAEQCGILTIADVDEPLTLAKAIAARAETRLLVFCDEDAEQHDPVAALAAIRQAHSRQPLAVLVGPEGGFSEEERKSLLRQKNIVRVALGPRILRADTAAVAALTMVQAVLGDWR